MNRLVNILFNYMLIATLIVLGFLSWCFYKISGCRSLSIILFVGMMFIVYWLPKSIIIPLKEYIAPNIITNFTSYSEVKLISFKPKNKSIIITIDDVPYNSKSFGQILDVLKKYNVTVSFFAISDLIVKNKELIDKAHNLGHDICNHGKTNSFHAIYGQDRIKQELNTCHNIIKEYRGSQFYRPGCGLTSRVINNIIDNNNKTNQHPSKIVLGSVYPHDPEIFSPEINFWYLKNHIQSGDIIILHDRDWTVPLLELLLSWLIENKFNCITLSEASKLYNF